jgi:hypothetical protein
MIKLRAALLAWLSLLAVSAAAQSVPAVTPHADGFRGIWFALGQNSKHGDKYSGGLGTYTANHTARKIQAIDVMNYC